MTEPESAEVLRRLREALSKRASIPVPRVTESKPDETGDDSARKEASALASGDLETQAAAREHDRTERFRDHFALAILIIFWMGAVALVATALVWGVNFFLPPNKAFLSSTQSDSIISFLTGGGITSFLANYAKNRLS